jgi:hypothetical protein
MTTSEAWSLIPSNRIRKLFSKLLCCYYWFLVALFHFDNTRDWIPALYPFSPFVAILFRVLLVLPIWRQIGDPHASASCLCLRSSWDYSLKTIRLSRAPVAHACNPSYLGSWDWEAQVSSPAWANISQDSISKIIRAKWTGGMAQAVKHLLCKQESLSSNSSPTPTPQKKNEKGFGSEK